MKILKIISMSMFEIENPVRTGFQAHFGSFCYRSRLLHNDIVRQTSLFGLHAPDFSFRIYENTIQLGLLESCPCSLGNVALLASFAEW